MLKEPPSIGEVLVPGVDPYNEQVLLEERYLPFRQTQCPVCGSLHRTTFRKLLSNHDLEGLISGDLSLRTVTISRCLHCGYTRPDRFFVIREV